MRKSMNNFYVSPKGEGDGKKDNPTSLEKVPDLIKTASRSMTSDINIYLEDGCYCLNKPIRIQGEDSGQNGFWVRWQTVENAKPVLTGEKYITNWEIHDNTNNIWKAFVPLNSDFEHLWFGRKRLTRAWSGWNPPGFKNSRKGLKLTKDAPDIKKWRNLNEIIVTKKMMWRQIPAKIHKITSNEIQLDPKELNTYSVPTTALGVMEPFSLFGLLNGIEIWTADYAIENAHELLTEEGEWYLDKATSVVYFKPESETDFNKKSILIYSNLKTFFLLDGTITQPVQNISIQGICFQYSKGSKMGVTAGFPTEPTKAITPKPESAIQVNAGHNILLQDNFFFHMGYDAVHFDIQGTGIKIIGNGFGDISRSAISLNQTNLVVSNQSKNGILPENQDKFFDGVEIKNNYIRVTGLDAPSPGISYSEFTRNFRFIHNEVRHTPIQAIRNSWRYLGWRGHAGNIEYAWNRTSEVGQLGLTDFGALYVSCANAGFIKIHHNYIDGVGINPSNAGIYLDVFVDKAEIYNNVSINMPSPVWWNRISRAWIALVMSTNTKIYNNWSDQLTYRDFDQGRYRFLWRDKSNQLYDNHLFEDISQLPPEAQEVLNKAGIEPPYRSVKERVDQIIS